MFFWGCFYLIKILHKNFNKINSLPERFFVKIGIFLLVDKIGWVWWFRTFGLWGNKMATVPTSESGN
ncbi:hypothetical protein A9G39_04110 [Gilliamella sp. Imp1-6]|nr:hypothetical protein A9G39_04110 [Gilliamella apicola]